MKCSGEDFCRGLQNVTAVVGLRDGRVVGVLHEGEITKVEFTSSTFSPPTFFVPSGLSKVGSVPKATGRSNRRGSRSGQVVSITANCSDVRRATSWPEYLAGEFREVLSELLGCSNLRFGEIEAVVSAGSLIRLFVTISVKTAPLKAADVKELGRVLYGN